MESEAVAAAGRSAWQGEHYRRCLDQTAELETPLVAALMLAEAVAAVRAVRAATLEVLVVMPGLAASVACQRSLGRLSPTLAAAAAGSTPLRRGTAREALVGAGLEVLTQRQELTVRQTPEAVLAVLALRQASPLAVRVAPALSSCVGTHRRQSPRSRQD
jgi:hypothetical protein